MRNGKSVPGPTTKSNVALTQLQLIWQIPDLLAGTLAFDLSLRMTWGSSLMTERWLIQWVQVSLMWWVSPSVCRSVCLSVCLPPSLSLPSPLSPSPLSLSLSLPLSLSLSLSPSPSLSLPLSLSLSPSLSLSLSLSLNTSQYKSWSYRSREPTCRWEH